MGDILILAILVVMTYFGYKKGFLRTLTGVLAIIISFVIALNFSPQIEAFIKTTSVYDTIYENIEKNVTDKKTPDGKAEEDVSNLNMPREMIKNIQENVKDTKSEITKSLTEKTGDIAVKILSVIFIFLAVRIIIFVLMIGFGFIKKLPFIGWFDGILGALFGFIRGFLVVYLLLTVVMVFTAFNVENPLVKSINHSEFAKVMYHNNVFLDFIEKD